MVNFSLVVDYLPFLVQGAWVTLQLSVYALAIGLFFGLILALIKMSNIKILVLIVDFYLWVMRGTPLLVQLFLVYFGLPQLGIDFTPMVAGVIALGANATAYIAEIYRGALLSIPKGQIEAAESLGMNYYLKMRKVVVPQAMRVALPALGNQAISMLKESSLASLVTVSELMMVSQRFAATNYAFIEFYIVAAGLYLLLTTIFQFILSKAEKRFAISER